MWLLTLLCVWLELSCGHCESCCLPKCSAKRPGHKGGSDVQVCWAESRLILGPRHKQQPVRSLQPPAVSKSWPRLLIA